MVERQVRRAAPEEQVGGALGLACESRFAWVCVCDVPQSTLFFPADVIR
jgi:hypothetical protein